MLAVAYGHIDAVSLLLEKEADVDAVDIMGCTALHRGVQASPQLQSGAFSVNLLGFIQCEILGGKICFIISSISFTVKMELQNFIQL